MMVIMEGELLMKVIGFLLPPVPHTPQRGMREEGVRA